MLKELKTRAPGFTTGRLIDVKILDSDIHKNSKLYLDRNSFFGIELNLKVGISAYYNGRSGKSSLVSADLFGYPK